MSLMAAPGLTAVSLIGAGVSGIVDEVLKQLTDWVGAGAASLVTGVGHALDATTSVTLTGGFAVIFRAMQNVGAQLVALFLGAAVIQAVVRQDFAALGRTVLLRLPLALVASGAAIEVVSLAVSATDELSAAVLGASAGGATSFLAGFAGVLGGSGGLPLAGFEAFVLAGVAAATAFVLWVELALRSAAVAVATVFIPLALAGAVWPATAHWAKRVGESIAALVLAKLVIATSLALAISLIGQPQGASGYVEGIALLLMSAVSPFAVLRIVAVVDAGAIAPLEEFTRRAARGGRAVASALNGLGGGAEEHDLVARTGTDVEWMPGVTFGGEEFERDVGEIHSRLEERVGQSTNPDGEGRAVPGGPPGGDLGG